MVIKIIKCYSVKGLCMQHRIIIDIYEKNYFSEKCRGGDGYNIKIAFLLCEVWRECPRTKHNIPGFRLQYKFCSERKAIYGLLVLFPLATTGYAMSSIRNVSLVTIRSGPSPPPHNTSGLLENIFVSPEMSQ
jgi:hypothetical protein